MIIKWRNIMNIKCPPPGKLYEGLYFSLPLSPRALHCAIAFTEFNFTWQKPIINITIYMSSLGEPSSSCFLLIDLIKGLLHFAWRFASTLVLKVCIFLIIYTAIWTWFAIIRLQGLYQGFPNTVLGTRPLLVFVLTTEHSIFLPELSWTNNLLN